MHILPPNYADNDSGIPVVVDDVFIETKAIWPGHFIVVRRAFFQLPLGERKAVLMHEVGHCKLWHREIRLLLLPLAWTKLARWLAHRQELAADAYAVRRGLGRELVAFLDRGRDQPGNESHPSADARIAAVWKLLQEIEHENSVAA